MATQRRVRSSALHHRTYWQGNNERSREESAWTWECVCGAMESASTKREAAREWMWHLLDIRERKQQEEE